jgi:hypothetical protein
MGFCSYPAATPVCGLQPRQKTEIKINIQKSIFFYRKTMFFLFYSENMFYLCTSKNDKNLLIMDRRLKIISITLGVVYVVCIGGSIYNNVTDFWLGFKKGFEQGLYNVETRKMNTLSSVGNFYINLKPENGFRTFPDLMLNQMDGTQMKAEIETMVVELNNVKDHLPKGTVAADIISFFMAFFTLFVMLFVPIQTFRIVHSITKDKIFNADNIRKLRQTGYALLAYFIADFVLNFLHYRIAAQDVRVEGYVLKMNWENTTLVLLGLVVLMFAEVLKVSVKMKEEQDLTV